MNDIQLKTTGEIAEYFALSRKTVDRLRKQGMPYYRFGLRLIRYNLKEVEAWLRERGAVV